MTLDVNIYEQQTQEYASFEDSSFVTGDSPATHNVFSALSRPGVQGYIVNDGTGAITVAFKTIETGSFGNEVTIKAGDPIFRLYAMTYYEIRVTWIADTSYRIFIQ